MKGILKYIYLILILMVASTTILLAQTVDEGGGAVGDFSNAFITFTALVAVIPTVTEIFKKILGKTSDTNNQLVQILSWLIGIAVTMFGWVFNLGFLSGMEWWLALFYGFGASLAANGIADTKIIQAIISLFGRK